MPVEETRATRAGDQVQVCTTATTTWMLQGSGVRVPPPQLARLGLPVQQIGMLPLLTTEMWHGRHLHGSETVVNGPGRCAVVYGPVT